MPCEDLFNTSDNTRKGIVQEAIEDKQLHNAKGGEHNDQQSILQTNDQKNTQIPTAI